MKNKYKNLVFIEKRHSLPQLTKPFQGTDTLFASIDEYIISDLERRGLDCLWLPSLLTAQDLKDIDQAAWVCASQNFAQDAELQNILSYCGIAIGSCGILQMNNSFVWALKIHHSIKKLFAGSSFEAVFAAEDAQRMHFSTLEPSGEDFLCRRSAELQGKKVQTIALRDGRKSSKGELKDFLKSILRSAAYFAELPRRNKKVPASDTRPAVLVSGAPNQILELMPHLEKKYRLVYLDLDYRLAKAPLLKNRGIPYFSFMQTCPFVSFWRRSKALKNKRLNKQSAEKAKKLLSTRTILDFRGENFFALLEPQFDYFLNEWMQERREYYDFFMPVLKKNKIQSLVLDEDTLSFKKTLVLAAKKMGLTSMVICHNSTPTFLGHELTPLTADWMAVGGKFIRENFAEMGIPKEKIIVSGLPRYDQIALQQTAMSEAKVRQILGVPAKSPIATLASSLHLSHRNTTRSWWELKKALVDALAVMCDFQDYAFIIKLHPLTDDDHLRELKRLIHQERPLNTFIVKNMDAPSLFSASKFVMTFFSSVITESLLLNKPTILLDYFDNEKLSYFIKEKSSFVVQDRQGLKAVVQAIIGGEAFIDKEFQGFREGLIENWASRHDGGSAARIAEFITKVVQ